MKNKLGINGPLSESNRNSAEPIGIVISNGRSAETVPAFRACIWYSYEPTADSTAKAKAA